MSAGSSTPVVLIMGVAGCGKTTAGERLAARMGWIFRDADSFHPPENVAKMSSGTPLDDEDRKPWLAAIAAWMDERSQAGEAAVVTCSALKRVYRDALVGERAFVRLVHLSGDKALIAARMAARKNHFMPTALLDSQFATLEPPGEDEDPLVVPITLSPDAVVDAIVRELRPEA
jgi:carbohydrate kinase (thermoresistant glucokinase family)